MRREGYFKTTAGKKAIKLMLRESLSDLNYLGRRDSIYQNRND